MISTIFAPATPPARSAVAVIRLSGPDSRRAVDALAGKAPSPRRASLRTLRFAGRTLDQALVLWMPGPASFTGEDSAEFHLHGGTAVVDAVSSALSDLGLEPAEPGAFTRRAFENGKLDLAEAEGLADLIDAETEAQRVQALDQLGGALSRRHERWRDLAIEALTYLEAAVDFPDEDLPGDVAARSGAPIRKLLEEIDAALFDAPRGEVVREGFRVAVIGSPNAGKSSLINALARRDAAIVTPVPGTTRDVIEVPLVMAGVRVLLADTAGLRETDDPIEAEGVRRARAWAASAHLRLWLSPPDDRGPPPTEFQDGDLALASKSDLGPPPSGKIPASVRSAGGLDALHTALSQRLQAAITGAHFPAITRNRHRAALSTASTHLHRAITALTQPELAAEDLRLALRALENVTGRLTSENVLNRLFSTFCIGK